MLNSEMIRPRSYQYEGRTRGSIQQNQRTTRTNRNKSFQSSCSNLLELDKSGNYNKARRNSDWNDNLKENERFSLEQDESCNKPNRKSMKPESPRLKQCDDCNKLSGCNDKFKENKRFSLEQDENYNKSNRKPMKSECNRIKQGEDYNKSRSHSIQTRQNGYQNATDYVKSKSNSISPRPNGLNQYESYGHPSRDPNQYDSCTGSEGSEYSIESNSSLISINYMTSSSSMTSNYTSSSSSMTSDYTGGSISSIERLLEFYKEEKNEEEKRQCVSDEELNYPNVTRKQRKKPDVVTRSIPSRCAESFDSLERRSSLLTGLSLVQVYPATGGQNDSNQSTSGAGCFNPSSSEGSEASIIGTSCSTPAVPECSSDSDIDVSATTLSEAPAAPVRPPRPKSCSNKCDIYDKMMCKFKRQFACFEDLKDQIQANRFALKKEDQLPKCACCPPKHLLADDCRTKTHTRSKKHSRNKNSSRKNSKRDERKGSRGHSNRSKRGC